MIRENWFDKEYNVSVSKIALNELTVEELLLEIARNPRIIQAVKTALANFQDQPGPSQTQAIRGAIRDTLNG